MRGLRRPPISALPSARWLPGETLTETEAAEAFELIMSGGATDAQIGALLMGMRVRGETVEEITGAARAMRARAVKVRAPEGAIDTCGTGGDAKGTHNISTCAAFVVAGAGVPVAKHGNRSISSRSGSADVLAALGVNIECAPETHRPLHRGNAGSASCSRRRITPPCGMSPRCRSELGTRTIFNLLGPLANPAGTKYQVVGVFGEEWVEPIAQVLGQLGRRARLGGAWRRRSRRAHHHRHQPCGGARRRQDLDLQDLAEECRAARSEA